MTMYAFAKYVPAKDMPGFEPDLPEAFGFLNIVDLGQGRNNWAVFQVCGDDDEMEAAGLDFVDREMRELLHSSEAYPPAIALARREIEELHKDQEPTREEFSRIYRDLLRKYLQQQENSGFFLVEGSKEEAGYLSVGEFVWALHYYPEKDVVAWVSDDYSLYSNSADYFALTEEQKTKLSQTRSGKDD